MIQDNSIPRLDPFLGFDVVRTPLRDGNGGDGVKGDVNSFPFLTDCVTS